MSDTQRKYAVTQTEVDDALKRAETAASKPAKEARENMAHAWNLSQNGSDQVGIHIRSSQTLAVVVTKKLEIKEKFILKAGYDQPEKLAAELSVLSNRLGTHSFAAVTLSGKYSPFLISKAPNVNRSMVVKALKIQLKALGTEEVDEISFAKIPFEEEGEGKPQLYIASAVTGPVLDRTVELLRKAKFRLHSWDTDILCYARAASFLWQKQGLTDETRFAVVIGANRTRLVLSCANGKFAATTIPFGNAVFLEQMALALGDPTVSANWLEEKKLIIQANDTKELIQQKAIANQAIYSLYVPFAQQIKMNLYRLCQENDMPIPEHFTVLGPGANLFRLANNLEVDLEMKRVGFPDSVDSEMAGAFGAALWERHAVYLNLLPGGGGGVFQRFRESVQILRGKLEKLAPKGLAKQGFGRLVAFGVVFLLLSGIYPFWSRFKVGKELEGTKRELDALGSKREEVQTYSKRQSLLEKKLMVKRTLEAKKVPVSPVFKDILQNLPPSVKLNSISLRETNVMLKGIARTQGDLESFLEQSSQLKTVGDASPLNIRREGETVSFEISLKVRPPVTPPVPNK